MDASVLTVYAALAGCGAVGWWWRTQESHSPRLQHPGWRVLTMIPTLFGISLVTFALVHLAPGDPGAASLESAASRGALSAEVIAQNRRLFHLDLPLFLNLEAGASGALTETRYAHWLGRFLRLDLGVSQHDQRRVSDKLAEALPRTFLLGGLALLLSWACGIPAGIFGALHRGKRADRALSLLLFAVYSVPVFFSASLLLLVFGGVGMLDWFPLQGLASPDASSLSLLARLFDLAWHLALPTFCLAYGTIAVLARQQRAALADALGKDYVRTARAKGLSRRAVVGHALRNALLPMITLLGLQIPTLVAGSVLVEQIFGIPGMGLLTYEAVLHRDYPTILAVASLSALITLGGLLLSDLLYAVADPRTVA
jgi:peptide/nickel transport system permease protein